ncbi:hypothetical protein [Roseobacter ponti]|uniref:Uncharacterized protein n=1 Tax=Roseobacter ponti TaxID=1891787 RepID=A0A858SXW4_9RHOB|nr:hypothetical protein [Roseobacter ponti]QJF52897.1 hypothetical protein G3256_17815 [Roseobacter ponti]
MKSPVTSALEVGSKSVYLALGMAKTSAMEMAISPINETAGSVVELEDFISVGYEVAFSAYVVLCLSKAIAHWRKSKSAQK